MEAVLVEGHRQLGPVQVVDGDTGPAQRVLPGDVHEQMTSGRGGRLGHPTFGYLETGRASGLGPPSSCDAIAVG
jgi:hypothetical protein